VSAWAGPTYCTANHTCVFLSGTFSQCIPIEQSRGWGCSAKYSQCGGTDAGVINAWSGPYCCYDTALTEWCVVRRDGGGHTSAHSTRPALHSVYFSENYSQCKPCNAVWEQARAFSRPCSPL
jgi:hypothetical protein